MLEPSKLLTALRKCASQKDAMLFLLWAISGPAQIPEIRRTAVSVGFRQISKWNIAAILSRASEADEAARLPDGWAITEAGIQHVAESGVLEEPVLIAEAKHSLRDALTSVRDENNKKFLEEAIRCFDTGSKRAAVIMAWQGGLWILQKHVASQKTREFNAAWKARFGDSKKIKTQKSFSRIQEVDFLQVCEDAGILDKSEKQQLGMCLSLRNDSGHPNSIELGDHEVAAHIERLALNVYKKYSS